MSIWDSRNLEHEVSAVYVNLRESRKHTGVAKAQNAIKNGRAAVFGSLVE